MHRGELLLIINSSRDLLFSGYCTMHYTLNVSQIRPFIENEESFRKFCHGGTTIITY